MHEFDSFNSAASNLAPCKTSNGSKPFDTITYLVLILKIIMSPWSSLQHYIWYNFVSTRSGIELRIACLNVHRGIYWVNRRYGTPITQIWGLENVILQGRHLHFWWGIITWLAKSGSKYQDHRYLL